MTNKTIVPGQGLDLENPNQTAENDNPIECFGKTFENDSARREYYLKILAEKLKDPEFRKTEGFPIGEDADILELSDPPYYTACPNPFVEEFIAHYGRSYDASEGYKREPYAADITEGKNHPIYNAHSYHTKVPHRAIMRFLLHYTNPSDVVFDGFCGTGMTGVAAQLCGDRAEIESLGYKVSPEGIVFENISSNDGLTEDWVAFSKLGKRHALLNDLSPAGTFIANNFNKSVDLQKFELEANNVIEKFTSATGWMWETLHVDGKSKGSINYVVWSDVYSCHECAGEVIYYDEVFHRHDDNVLFNPEFQCPSCNCLINKSPKKGSSAMKPSRVFESYHDPVVGKVLEKQKQKAVLINYSVGSERFEKEPDEEDLNIINKNNIEEKILEKIPNYEIREGEKSSDPYSCGIRYVHQFYSGRILNSLNELLNIIKEDSLQNFIFGSMLPKLTKMNRYMPQHGSRALVGPMANTLYVPAVAVENNVIDQFVFQYKKILKALNSYSGSLLTTQAAQSVNMPPESLDYIFLDPPFGANIMYSELSYIREAWLHCLTNQKPEAIESKAQCKSLDLYMHLMKECFENCYRYLKPGRWLTVEFSNTKSSVWNAIQYALTDAGFVVASVAALDKSRGGLHSMLGPTAVKQDLIISAYKPNGGFEDRFKAESDVEGVWDFIKTHLGYLPVIKRQADEIVKIPERDPRILFDQVVAYFVKNSRDVPISSKEFQEGLTERFSEKDGMVYLPEQVAEYEKARISGSQLKQLSIFVDDEASAIDWLRQLLNEKPQSYQDIHPKFIHELSGWRKSEDQLELSTLLEQNFIKYDGLGPLPPQIHSYLSTNFKGFRNLKKEDSLLIKKSKGRWYVPNPEREEDLQKLRERSLLSEFDGYKKHNGKKLKKVRMEAVRCGFKKAWQNRDYSTIINVAEKIPQDLLQGDQKLLMWYDQAQTRVSDNSLF